jgi:hypothetical protein
MVFALAAAGCSNPYEECIEQQKAEYRQRNPGASYGQVQSRQMDFELMCSKFRTKGK